MKRTWGEEIEWQVSCQPDEKQVVHIVLKRGRKTLDRMKINRNGLI